MKTSDCRTAASSTRSTHGIRWPASSAARGHAGSSRPTGSTPHPDHVAATELIEAARFWAKLTKSDIPGEPHFPERIFYYYCVHLRVIAQPAFVVDISDFWEKKRAAIECYREPIPDRPAGRRADDRRSHSRPGGVLGLGHQSRLWRTVRMPRGGGDLSGFGELI